jgi:hypothetical protein
MRLSDQDQAMLAGRHGSGIQLAMEMLIRVGEVQEAPDLIDVTGAHIDSCLYHGQAGLDFARALSETGAQVAVPTTLNVSSLDLLHPNLYRGSAETAAASKSLMDAYTDMGCQPTWTCAPYQLAERPGFGEQVAWGESNAIVFANSVLGARTERYGDFLDICCALTGRAPNVGLHTSAGRKATAVVELDLPDGIIENDALYPVLGSIIGEFAGTRVVAVVGLDDRAGEDELKALGAAAATRGAVAMFHVVGVTPEAGTLAMATQGFDPEASLTVDVDALNSARAAFATGVGPLGAVSVGTPHFSIAEFRELASLIEGETSAVPFYVSTGRDVLDRVSELGIVEKVEAFGATIVTDTCTYITPILEDVEGVVLTNSGKWALYAPGNLGVDVAFGSLRECVESATAGALVMDGGWLG